MIAANYYRCFYFSSAYKFVKGKSCLFPLTLSQPANARRQSLECDPFPGHFHPSHQRLVLRKQFHDYLVRDSNIIGIATQCCPTEWALAFTEKWPDISRNKTRI